MLEWMICYRFELKFMTLSSTAYLGTG
jgi:hypothetical protein